NGGAGYSQYGKRWTALTKAKLLLKQQQFEKAVKWLGFVEGSSGDAVDRPFHAAVHLLSAQAFHRVSRPADCARRILRAEFGDVRQCSDLHGQFHYLTGLTVTNASSH